MVHIQVSGLHFKYPTPEGALDTRRLFTAAPNTNVTCGSPTNLLKCWLEPHEAFALQPAGMSALDKF